MSSPFCVSFKNGDDYSDSDVGDKYAIFDMQVLNRKHFLRFYEFQDAFQKCYSD